MSANVRSRTFGSPQIFDWAGMDTTTVIVIAILMLVVVLAFLYRGRIRFALKALGISAEIEGEGRKPETGAATTGDDAPDQRTASSTKATEASGPGSVAIGGSANQAKISTKVEREN